MISGAEVLAFLGEQQGLEILFLCPLSRHLRRRSSSTSDGSNLHYVGRPGLVLGPLLRGVLLLRIFSSLRIRRHFLLRVLSPAQHVLL